MNMTMWIIAKIKNNEIETFKKTFQEKLKENVDFYIPKMEMHKKMLSLVILSLGKCGAMPKFKTVK